MKKNSRLMKLVACALVLVNLLAVTPVFAAALPAQQTKAAPGYQMVYLDDGEALPPQPEDSDSGALPEPTAEQPIAEEPAIEEQAAEDLGAAEPIQEETAPQGEPSDQTAVTIELANVDLLRAFVVRLYELVMERTPDQTGLDFWVQSLQNRTRNAAHLVEYFFQSDEYKAQNRTDDEYIRALYRTMMGREADAVGLAYWNSDLASGLSRRYLLHQFVASPEFETICAGYGIERGVVSLVEKRDQNKALTTFVNQFYLNCMGRPGDADGLNYWTDELMAGRQTGADMAEYFFFQQEFTGKNTTDTEFVQYAYRAMFNREPDAPGLAFWVEMQQKGVSRKYVLSRMVSVAEFREQCDKAGIPVGSISLTENRDKNDALTGFVNNLYIQTLGRPGDVDGLNHYIEELLSKNKGGINVVQVMLQSPEFAGRNLPLEEYIRIVYRVMFGREADPVGLAYWMGIGVSGVSRDYLINAMSGAEEFRTICANLGINVGTIVLTEARDKDAGVTGFVTNAMRNLWGSDADVAAINDLCNQVLANKSAAATVLYNMTLSANFTSRNLDKNGYVIATFNALCGKAPTTEELGIWTGALTDYSREDLRYSYFMQLAQSPLSGEYFSRQIGINTFTTKEHGIDVSAHQGNVDWAQVAASGYTFAMIRVVTTTSGGTSPSIDAYFYKNVREARKAGLKVGAYIYTYAKDTAYLDQELGKAFEALNVLRNEGIRLDYPVAMDFEEFGRRQEYGKREWTNLAKYSLAVLDQKKYWPMLYTFAYAYNERFYMNELAGYDCWVADFRDGRTEPGYPGAMWQYTSEARIAGISGKVDLDWSYKDFAKIIRENGYNHYPAAG